MSQFWNDITEIPEARWIIYGTLLVFAVLVAVYVSLFFRNMAISAKDGEELDLLSEFRNLRDQGHLDNNEYNRLKTVVPENVKHELLRGTATGNVGGNLDNGVEVETQEGSGTTKKFLTLAEAESRKKASTDSDGEQEDS